MKFHPRSGLAIALFGILAVSVAVFFLLNHSAAVAQQEKPEPNPQSSNREPVQQNSPPSPTASVAQSGTAGGHSAEGSLAELRARLPELSVEFDPISGSPKYLGSNRAFLSSAAATDPRSAVKSFIDSNSALFGHNSDAIEKARLVRDDVTDHSGLRTLVWQQQVAGIPVFEAVFQAHLTGANELVSIGSQFLADPDTAAVNGTPGGAAAASSPVVSPEKAVELAANEIGERVAPGAVRALAAAEGAERHQRWDAPGLSDTTAGLVWLPVGRSRMRLCWNVVLAAPKKGQMYRVLVDALDGTPRLKRVLTNDISDATYNVYTSDSPSPFSPGHATPLSTQPSLVSRVLVTTPALNTTASPNGWINDGGNETVGNNVDAHTDTNADNIADTPRPQGSPARVFNFTLDLTQAPSTYKDAAVTQLFYWCNFAHDKLYELGFTESAGNFQTNNFGKGGLGNDAVQADAQDGSGTNNANFSTPSDGSAGRMQMYVFDGPTPDRDGDLDAEIILHEYTHGLSNRLVGGGVGISTLQPGGMGEGWSDFYGLSLLSEATDAVNGNYAAGGYATYQLSGLTQNYYYGIRRYPYSTDMNKNPLTFKDIDPTKADAHTGVPRSPIIGNTANEVHNMGEVWCVTLWDARANLIAKYGAATGNQLMLQLVTDGMKLSPANPTFLQARDAILQADLVKTGGQNRVPLWTAFAKRGMGASATAPASSTSTGVFEAFDFPDALSVSPTTPVTTSGTIGGPFSPGTFTYTLVNTGSTSLTWSGSSSQSWMALSPVSGTIAAGGTTAVLAVVTDAANTLVSGSYLCSLGFTDIQTGAVLNRQVTLTAAPPRAAFYDLSTDPGWPRQGEWAYGTPTGGGGASHGNHDPTSGATGTKVFGINLAGDYSLTVGGTYYLTTSAIDLSNYTGTQLRFKRWLNCDYPPYVNDTIQVSNNGSTWTTLYTNPSGTEVADSSWTTVQYDISAVADKKSTVFIRWGHQVGSSGVWAYSGWNIDDVELLGNPTNTVTLGLPARATEGTAALSGTVTVTTAPASTLTLNLTSSDTSSAIVPSTVSIGAGQTSATFPITIVDDTVLNGTRIATITAGAAGYTSVSGTITVDDNETAVLTWNLPSNVKEGNGTVSATLQVSGTPARNVTVSLTSSNTNAAIVPASVTIPAGQPSVPVPVTIVDDPYVDGTETTTLTASVTNWTAAASVLPVQDNESTQLAISMPASLREGSATVSGTVSASGILLVPLTVTLSSSDESELTVASTVQIPAGQSSGTFQVNVVDDTDADGPQPVTVRAQAPGFTEGSAAVSVLDNDAHHFTFETVGNPQIRNLPFTVKITAKDQNDVTLTDFQAPVTLTGSSATGAISVAPATLTGWINGTWSGTATVGAFAKNIFLTASDGYGHSGTSNAFDTTTGPLHHYAWGTLASPQTQENFFGATIVAEDAANNSVTTEQGQAALKLKLPSVATADIGSGTTTWDYPLHTYYHDSRTQVIYLPGELGGTGQARRITALSLNVTTVPGQALGNWTIRMKHSGSTAYPDSGAQWEGSGWTTVYQATQTMTQTGWITFPFTSPFDYDGQSALLVDFSHNNSSFSASGIVRATASTFNRSIYYFTDSGYGDPLTWSGETPAPVLSNYAPDLRLQFESDGAVVPISPQSTGTFTNGVWVGQIGVPCSGAGMKLIAQNAAGISGTSNAITVQPASVPSTVSSTLFTETFESGTLGSMWTVSGVGPYRTQVTSANNPHGGTRHLTMDSGTDGVYARNEATLTLNLTGKSGVVLKFWAVGFNDEANAPATNPFQNGADFDGVAISADGVTWYEVQALRSLTTSYAEFTVDLDAAVASHGLSYNSAFKIRFNQYDNYAIATDGIGFDDISVTCQKTPTAQVSAPAQVMENAGTLSGTVSLSTTATSNTSVSLASNANARISVPANITIPAGTISGTFAIAVVDNTLLDGNRTVTITATPPDGNAANASILVVDNETTQLAFSAPASVTEGDVGISGTATLGAVPSGQITFNLVSSDTTAVLAPSTFTFEPGQLLASIPLTVVDDQIVDGPQNAIVTASATGWNPVSTTITVADNDTAILQVTPEPVLTATATYGNSLGLKTSYLLTNNGNAPLPWSASKTANWIALPVMTGTLAAGASTGVEITVSATGLNPAVYTGTLAFTNTANGVGNSDRVVSLAVLPAAPNPAVEPLFTGGTTNTISWNSAPGVQSYELLCASGSQFTNASSTGWITGTSFTQTGLLNGVAYYYKVRARNTAPDSPSGPGEVISDWSAPVSSTQDSAPPVVAIAPNQVTTAATFQLAGSATDLAGISSVAVNGITVSSTDSFAHWAWTATNLSPGYNTFTVTASDTAVPANTGTTHVKVYYATASLDADNDNLPDDWEAAHGLDLFNNAGEQGPLGDPDHDGLPNLLEYALNLDPQKVEPDGSPTTAVETSPADGQSYLMFRYRRRINATTLLYQPEVSHDMATWHSNASDFEELTPASPNPDGVTETVTLQIKPPLGTPGFGTTAVRLRISIAP